MADYYSDLLTDAGTPTALSLFYKAPVGISHSRKRGDIGRLSAQILTGEVARMITVRSSTRLLSLKFSGDGGATAGTANVGLYLAGENHDGAVIDADLFQAARNFSAAADDTDIFSNNVLSGVDRGKTMWEIANLGGASYTEDPGLKFDIAYTGFVSLTVAPTETVLISEYTAGD